jgi:hypothetical protein
LNKHNAAARVLLIGGSLLCMIALVHLFDTPLTGIWLKGQLSAETLRSISPNILLSQFIGIIIIPFGVSTMYSAAGVRLGHQWARKIAMTNAIAVIIIPLLLFYISGSQYTISNFLLPADIAMAFIGVVTFVVLLWL